MTRATPFGLLHRLALAVAASAALALPTTRAVAQLSIPADIDPKALGLSTRPIIAESVGIAFYPPRDCLLTTETINGSTSLVLVDPAPDPRWRMRVQTLESTLPQPDAKAIVDDHLAKLAASGQSPRVVENRPVACRGVPGQLLLVSQPDNAGREVVNGWLVLPRGGNNFVVLTILTSGDQLATLRPQLDASFSTISLASPDRLHDIRVTRIETASKLLEERFTPSHLRSLLGERTWYRIYKPAADGAPGGVDQEIGYMAIQAVEAMRGELEPSRDPSKLSGDETEPGLMIVLQARALLDAKGEHLFDVDGRYWMAWDRSSEAWSNRSTERQGKATRGFKQTGIRSAASAGEPRSILTVVNDSSTGQVDTRPQKWPIPEKGYLCQPELMFLGALLPRDAGDLELSFYCFDTKENRLPQRLDRWAKSGDGSGNWILTSQPSLDAPSVTQVFDANGNRLRRVDNDGTVTERIDAAALLRLWKSKGLPTSSP